MRIDLNAIIPEVPDPGQSAKSSAQGTSGSSSAVGVGGGDTAKLSQDQGRVQELASQVNQLPEIRQDKVSALQRALGKWHVRGHVRADGGSLDFRFTDSPCRVGR